MKKIISPYARIAAGTLCLLPATLAAQQRYNIVYIMTDDHTAQMMSCYDGRYVNTPNLDRIANDGVKFTRSYVANSLSGPSRACMLTGKHSHKNGFTNNEHGIFDGSQQTMPKLLQKAGYQTAIIGKWHLVSDPTGFDFWNIVPGQGDYYNPSFITMNKQTVREEGYLTNIITDKSIDWMEHQRDKERPFALFIHHKACHRNWLPELKYLHEYEDTTFPIPETFYDDYATRHAAPTQEMSIAEDMDMAYDIKMYHPESTFALPALVKAIDGICRKNGEEKPNETLQKMIFGGYNKKIANPRTASDWLTRDEAIVDAYVAHPLCGFTPACGLLRDMMKGIYYVEQPENLTKMKKHLPVLFIAGTEDPVGPYGKGVEKAAAAFIKAGMSNVSLKLYPDCRHEILNELNKQEVYDDICTWLAAYIGR